MTIPSVPRQILSQESEDFSRKPHRAELRDAISKFLAAAGCKSPGQSICPRCGAEMQYIDTTFQVYGAESKWHVRLPYFPCQLGASQIENGTTADLSA